jgi:hypothetical protein
MYYRVTSEDGLTVRYLQSIDCSALRYWYAGLCHIAVEDVFSAHVDYSTVSTTRIIEIYDNTIFQNVVFFAEPITFDN